MDTGATGNCGNRVEIIERSAVSTGNQIGNRTGNLARGLDAPGARCPTSHGALKPWVGGWERATVSSSMGMLRDKPTEEAIGYRAVVFLRAARNAQAGWNENGMYGLEHVEHGTRPRATRATSGGPEQMTKSAPKLEPAAYARAQRALRQVIREHPDLPPPTPLRRVPRLYQSFCAKLGMLADHLAQRALSARIRGRFYGTDLVICSGPPLVARAARGRVPCSTCSNPYIPFSFHPACAFRAARRNTTAR